ncbi:MAG TPA: GYD domain-containing protein [Methylomirabilota bacterium]|nr:GYD domain-containing protein [Methylomirabilota bacterium]
MAKRRTSPKAAATKAAAASPSRFYYLVQFSYTAAAWADLVRGAVNRDRAGAVYALLRRLDGCFAEIKFPCDPEPVPREKFGSFGDHDVVALLSFPSDENAAAFAMAIAAGGGVTHFKTTRILPWSVMESAMNRAADGMTTYVAPGRRT